MVDVISAFREQDTRDELGIGTIRDGFADILFPGTSTIQTRARYFLFIPWMYLALERKKVPIAKAAEWARGRETALIYALESPAIGAATSVAKPVDKLKRLPSNIYWQGLCTWGIRQFAGSQDQYHRSLDHYYGPGARCCAATTGRCVRILRAQLALSSALAAGWIPMGGHLRAAPEESEYLRGRIRGGARLISPGAPGTADGATPAATANLRGSPSTTVVSRRRSGCALTMPDVSRRPSTARRSSTT